MNLVFASSVDELPLEESTGARSRRPPGVPVVIYSVAAALAGALSGLLFALLGQIATSAGNPVVVASGAAVVLAVAALDWSGHIGRVPQRRRQVPREWTLWPSASVAALAFGSMLGAGFLTRLHYASAYALAITLAVSADLVAAVAVGATYGLGRGTALAASWGAVALRRRTLDWEFLTRRRAGIARALAALAVVTFAATATITL